MPLLWSYPDGPLPPLVEYRVEIEADEHNVVVMVARDTLDIPQGVAVAIGDDPSDLGDVLSTWDIGFPPD